MKIERYTIVTMHISVDDKNPFSPQLENFIDSVNTKISFGWEPLGQVVISGTCILQTMVLKK